MSTEHQRYSLKNQRAAIAEYAQVHGFEVCVTYADPATSGVTFAARMGLQALLRDVLEPERRFEAILIFDVSRFGRFQDPDEGAYYEFICRRAGARVIYCAEPFRNDGALFDSVAKVLKRAMAGEYSRELSERIRHAHLVQARLGFWQGGPAPYGFRRVLVDRTGDPVRVLEKGERKPLKTDRVVLAMGPEAERSVIRTIFRLHTRDRLAPLAIAKRLNAAEIPCPNNVDGKWRVWSVRLVLDNELVTGWMVFSRRSATTVGGARKPLPPEEHVRVKVLQPIVSERLFKSAHAARAERKQPTFTKAELLAALKALWRKHGYLTAPLINASPETPSVPTYEAYFGTLAAAYAKIGYASPYRQQAKMTDAEMLASVRRVYERHGYVSARLLNIAPDAPGWQVVRDRFGSVRRAYELAGVSGVAAPRRPDGRRWTDEALLEALREVWREHGYISSVLLHLAAGPGVKTLVSRFGSLEAACARAGLSVSLEMLRIGAYRTRQAIARSGATWRPAVDFRGA